MLPSTPISVFTRVKVSPSEVDKVRLVSADARAPPAPTENRGKVNFIEYLSDKLNVETVLYLVLILTIFTNVAVLSLVFRIFFNS